MSMAWNLVHRIQWRKIVPIPMQFSAKSIKGYVATLLQTMQAAVVIVKSFFPRDSAISRKH